MKIGYRLIGLAIMTLVVAGAAYRAAFPAAGVDMTEAAQKYLDSLSDTQRIQSTMAFDAADRVDWHFIPKAERKGLQIKEMNDEQRKAAHALLQAALSEVGYTKATTIMSLEAILHELEKGRSSFARDPERYYFTIFGTPTSQSPWGLSVEGHHLSLNFVVRNGKIDAHTPAFFGANPAVVKSNMGVGPKPGTQILDEEERLAFELLASFDEQQRRAAVVADQAPRDIRAAGSPQPPTDAPDGLAAENMTARQLQTLRRLITAYTENMPAEVAARRWSEFETAGFGNIHFAWAGADHPGIGHYYRIQGPTFLIELCNTQPDSAGNPANHVHSVWRDTSGDFGIAIDH